MDDMNHAQNIYLFNGMIKMWNVNLTLNFTHETSASYYAVPIYCNYYESQFMQMVLDSQRIEMRFKINRSFIIKMKAAWWNLCSNHTAN